LPAGRGGALISAKDDRGGRRSGNIIAIVCGYPTAI
jgi:hypothetical protein